jgi:hypothetical protein
MKKLIMVLLGFALIIGAVSAVANPQFVTLVEKNSADWSIVDDGASAKMMYKDTPKPMFVFNAHGMEVGTTYSLISYAEPWGTPVIVQGTGVADEFGDVHIKGGALNLVCNDYTGFTEGDYTPATGYTTGSKIWLVPSADLTGTAFNAWTPDTYLFETDLINQGCSVPA